jgi:hypothetical protein
VQGHAFRLVPEEENVLNEPEIKIQNGQPDPQINQDIKADLEAEAAANDRLVEEATSPLRTRLESLEAALASKNAEVEALKVERQAASDELAGAKAAYAYAVADYRRLCLASNPLITEDMIAGDSIEEMKASLSRANGLINRLSDGIRKDIETDQNKAKVPAGAPPRTEPDLGAMSTVEKIQYGMEKAKKKT